MKLADELKQDSAANLDDATLNQQQQIENEIAAQQELITKKLPIESIRNEYKLPQNEIYAAKAKDLAEAYSHVRRVRGDGNCFYRALAFAQCERLLNAGDDQLKKFAEESAQWKRRLLKLGFPDMTTEDFVDSFVESLTNFKSESDLMETFANQAQSNYLVVFMRLVTSGYLKENEEKFGGFIEGGRTMEAYCKQDVEPMAKECDHMCITALTSALNVPLRIEYMDQTLSPGSGRFVDFLPNPQTDKPVVYFLYRPGHYDVLYPK